MNKVVMTREGYNKLNSQYLRIKSEEIPYALQSLSDARDKGDVSENAEYEIAKEVLEALNLKASNLSTILSKVQIIEGAVDNGTVQLLTYVKVKNLSNNKEFEYKIVPENESSLKEMKISYESPIGKGLFGNKVGDIIEIAVPVGKLKLEILNISLRKTN